MSVPTLIFIPGFWEGAAAFSKVVKILESEHSYPVKVIPLISTGTEAPNAKTFSDDVDAIRDVAAELANDGREMVFIMHSAGGFIGSQALAGLGLPRRKQRGEVGGVRKLVYLTGALLPEGSDHPPVPFFQTTGPRMYSRDPLADLFHDLPAIEATKGAEGLSWQPATYVESIHVSYGAWKEIPSVYLCCTQDRVIPVGAQQQMAAMAGAETESCDAGHMVPLSRPERVVEFVCRAAAAGGGVEV